VYADERRLFALIGLIIVAASLALIQIGAARRGQEGPVIWAGSSVAMGLEEAASTVAQAARSAGEGLLALPQLATQNSRLRSANDTLRAQNAVLREQVAQERAQQAIMPAESRYPDGVAARIVGFPPENESQSVTIDRGSSSGIKVGDGVITGEGVVGRIASVGPFSSSVLLITDYTSRIPAIVREGRWWGIAQGNLTSVRLQYVSQDASLRPGDVVLTGNGQSFDSGVPIGTIVEIERSDAALYQTAVVRPAVELGTLDRVVVLTSK
jgi:rod shape-determining protein MreC